jgi:hypothetical protein
LGHLTDRMLREAQECTTGHWLMDDSHDCSPASTKYHQLQEKTQPPVSWLVLVGQQGAQLRSRRSHRLPNIKRPATGMHRLRRSRSGNRIACKVNAQFGTFSILSCLFALAATPPRTPKPRTPEQGFFCGDVIGKKRRRPVDSR